MELNHAFGVGGDLCMYTCTQLGILQSLLSHPGAKLETPPGTVQCIGKSPL